MDYDQTDNNIPKRGKAYYIIIVGTIIFFTLLVLGISATRAHGDSLFLGETPVKPFCPPGYSPTPTDNCVTPSTVLPPPVEAGPGTVSMVGSCSAISVTITNNSDLRRTWSISTDYYSNTGTVEPHSSVSDAVPYSGTPNQEVTVIFDDAAFVQRFSPCPEPVPTTAVGLPVPTTRLPVPMTPLPSVEPSTTVAEHHSPSTAAKAPVGPPRASLPATS